METDHAHALPPGTRLGRYAVVRPLGEGGMGAVYEARHEELDKRVAVKVLHPELARDPEARLRFLREGRAAVRIQHPHVVDVADVGLEGATAFLVMEYLEGESLAALLRREGPLPVARIADLLLPVVAAVACAHDAAVVHRDLKPENVFLARTRHGAVAPKVLDFGIARVLDDRRTHAVTRSAALLGTPHYMAPEQARDARAADTRSDQYSLGVILYECATGRRPIERELLFDLLVALVDGAFEPPRRLRPDLPEAFEAVVLRAMRKAPDERFPSLLALGHALLPFAGAASRAAWEPVFGAAPATAPAPRAPAPEGAVPAVATDAPVHRRAPLVGASVAALLLAPATVFLLTREPARQPVTREASPVAAPAAPLLLDVQVTPETAALVLDGAPAGTGRLHRLLPRDGREHRLLVRADGYVPRELVFREAPPRGTIVLSPMNTMPPREPATARPRVAAPPPRRPPRTAGSPPEVAAPPPPAPAAPPPQTPDAGVGLRVGANGAVIMQ